MDVIASRASKAKLEGSICIKCGRRAGKGHALFFFPKDETLCKAWCDAMDSSKDFKPTRISRLCSRHFKPEDIETLPSGKLRLKRHTVPSVFDFPKNVGPESEEDGMSTSSGTDTELDEINDVSPSKTTAAGTSQTRRRKARKRTSYVGDFSLEDLKCPEKAAKYLEVCSAKVEKKNKGLRNLRKQNKRLLEKVTSMEAHIIQLKEEKEEAASRVIYNASLPLCAKEMFERTVLKSDSHRQPFPPAMKAFAYTLNFYSRQAYNFVRETFSNCLPHPKTISRWFRTGGAANFSEEALSILREIVDKSDRAVVCRLTVDDISTRYKVWEPETTSDLEDEEDSSPPKQAVVFLLSCTNLNWKLPLGYFYISGLSAAERANLVTNSLRLLQDLGVTVVKVDGAAVKADVAESLGCSTWEGRKCFPHPSTGEEVDISFKS